MTFAGCPLPPETFQAWQSHWAPTAQPFFVSDALSQRLPPWPRLTRRAFEQSGVSLSLRDTFRTYRVSADPPWVVWLGYTSFAQLEPPVQQELLNEQRTFGREGVVSLSELAGLLEPPELAILRPHTADGLFVWWPELWASLSEFAQEHVLSAFVEADRLPCRRPELSRDHWQRALTVLPGARELAGTFLLESGGNCLGTVMAACGAPALAAQWVHPEPFERWLTSFSPLPKGAEQDPEPGTLLVWRDDQARVQHAAASLGQGFVLHKEEQTWYAPRQVVGLSDALERWQDAGRLSLYRR